MRQLKFSLNKDHVEFLQNYSLFGFKDKSSMVRAGINLLKKEINKNELKKSAELYAEVYEEDKELQMLTETAISDWPEK